MATQPQTEIYTIELPDGSQVDVEGPAGANEQELHTFLQSQGMQLGGTPTQRVAPANDVAPPPAAATPAPQPEQVDRSAPIAMADSSPGTAVLSTDVKTVTSPYLQRYGDQLGRMVAAGVPDAEIQDFLKQTGAPADQLNIGEALAFRHTPQFREWKRQNPGKPYPFNPEMTVPLTADEKAGAELRAQPVVNALGTAAAGAADTASLGLFDEAAGLADPQFRQKRDLAADDNRLAYTLGQIGGGLGFPSGAMEAGAVAARAAMRQGLGREAAKAAARRAIIAQSAKEGAAYGGIYGAGSADGDLADRAAGAVVGVLTGGTVGGAVATAGTQINRLRGALPRADREGVLAARAAERQGIDLLPQDIAGAGIQRATQGTAQTPFGARPIADAADQLYTGFRDRVGELAGPAGTTREVGDAIAERAAQGMSREAQRADTSSNAVQNALGQTVDETAAGQLVQRGVSRWMDDTAKQASKLYEQVPIAPEQPAVLDRTRSTLRDITATWRSNPELGAAFRNSKLARYLDALTPTQREVDNAFTGVGGGRDVVEEGGQLSWRDLSEFRTRVGDMLADPQLTQKIAPRQLRALYGALTSDMEATASQAGPNALAKWKRANNYYDGRMKRINDTLSLVVGDRKDMMPNEAVSSLNRMLQTGSGGNAAAFARIMRSLPAEDASTVRASIVQSQRGGREFDPAAFAKSWDNLSERGKSALLPGAGMREIMDDAAARAAVSQKDPLAGKSGEQAFLALERMATNRGDSAQFQARMASMSPEEANSVRALMIKRMGLSAEGAQNAEGDAFSISRFLTRWNGMTREAKQVLFGDAEMRAHMNDLARIAERVKASEKPAGHSNTGAVNSLNATTGGLAGAAIAALSGHPVVAAGLAAPAAYQRISAEVLTSKRFLNWLLRSANKPNVQAERHHIARLATIAAAEPAISADILTLQKRLAEAFTGNQAMRAAADEPGNGSLGVGEGEGVQGQNNPQELPQ